MPKIGPHSRGKFQTPTQIGERLRLIRIAYGKLVGYPKEIGQSELARLLDVGVSAWNNSETGDARIGLDNAIKLRRVTGASLDYIYEGDASKMPHDLMREIAALLRQQGRDRA